MTKKLLKTKAAGILILIGGTGHLVPSLAGTSKTWGKLLKAGWWNQVPPPWTGSGIFIQKAFWTVWGSFAFPCLILGALIVWLAKKDIKIPRFIGFGLTA